MRLLLGALIAIIGILLTAVDSWLHWLFSIMFVVVYSLKPPEVRNKDTTDNESEHEVAAQEARKKELEAMAVKADYKLYF